MELLEIRPFTGPGRVQKILFSSTNICSRSGLSCTSRMIKLYPWMHSGMNPKIDVMTHGYDTWLVAILRPDFILRDQDQVDRKGEIHCAGPLEIAGAYWRNWNRLNINLELRSTLGII